MIYERFKKREEGFLLVDSLLTLSIIMVIILFLTPLLTNWLEQRQQAKQLVEESRLIYEESMEIINKQRDSLDFSRDYFINDEYQKRLNGQGTGVVIHEKRFEYE